MTALDSQRCPPSTGTGAEQPSLDENEESVMLKLPELPLMHVLSWLPATDLAAVGRVCRHWRAQVPRRRLWRRQRLTCSSLGRLRAVVRVAPRWDTLVIRMQDMGAELVAQFEENARRLVVCLRSPSTAALVIGDAELGQRATRLTFKEVDHYYGPARVEAVFTSPADSDALWAGLLGARSLQTLDLVLVAGGPLALSAFRWPEDKAPLRKLQNVQLELVGVRQGKQYECPALESVLQANSDTLRCVKMFSSGLASLLNRCSPLLRRVTVPGNPGFTSHLQRFTVLEELQIEGLHPRAMPELESLFRDRLLAGLRCLSLRSGSPCLPAVRAVATLSQLTDLRIAAPHASLAELGEVLASLPRLRHLAVLPAPTPDALDAIRGDAFPSLVSLTVLGDPCKPLDPLKPPTCRKLALRRLILRACVPLHVVCEPCPCRHKPSAPGLARFRLLAKHKPVDDLWGCPQCVEVTEARKAVYGPGAGGNLLYVQVADGHC